MENLYNVVPYDRQYYKHWNDFVAKAKNATFLFHRDFMDYHSHRFEDCSLLIFKNNILISVLPAHLLNNNLHSHQGLSYGGFVFAPAVSFPDCLEAVKHTLQYGMAHRIKTLHLKLIPRIYQRFPADEINYLLFLLKARLTRSDLSSCIVISESRFAANRQEGIKRGQRNKLIVKEETDMSSFWNLLLIPQLHHKYHTRPVHSLEEIQYLQQKFPENIRQFNVYDGQTLVAGTTVFETPQVAHTQYIASNSDKNRLGSLDLLFHHLITEVFTTKKYFDFGISNENNGQYINKGLLYWKQGYGSGSVVHDFYEVDCKNHTLLNTVFI